MSVYKRPGAQTYSYDFQVAGARFSGDTGATSKREAERIQEVERARARAAAAAARPGSGRAMTLAEATLRYMLEVGEHHRNALTTLKSMEWLEQQLGRGKRLSAIDDADVARLVATRRLDVAQVGRPENRQRRISPATVNRTATEPLRKLLTRARKVWKVPVAEIDWAQHMLAEPQERVREASIGEEAAIMATLARGYDDAVRFAFLTGCRRMEILGLCWRHVDFFGRQFTVTGKGGRSRTIPMSQAIYDLLWSLRHRHAETVFCFMAQKTRRDGTRHLIRGQWYPLSDGGLKSAMRRAVAGAGVENFRFHDTRHTAATRVLRKSNLRVAQVLLGHADIATTTKYAHAVAEDLRAALEAAGEPSSAHSASAMPSKRGSK